MRLKDMKHLSLNQETKEYYTRPMRISDIKRYFIDISVSSNRMTPREKGTYCQRCGIKELDLVKYKGYNICKDCYNRKKAGERNTPDIEDLIKYKIKL